MKKTILALALIAVATTAFAQDTLFGSLGDLALKARNLARETIETDAVAIEADGGNFRAYFFEAPGNTEWICFVVAGTQKGGPACYPKGK